VSCLTGKTALSGYSEAVHGCWHGDESQPGIDEGSAVFEKPIKRTGCRVGVFNNVLQTCIVDAVAINLKSVLSMKRRRIALSVFSLHLVSFEILHIVV